MTLPNPLASGLVGPFPAQSLAPPLAARSAGIIPNPPLPSFDWDAQALMGLSDGQQMQAWADTSGVITLPAVPSSGRGVFPTYWSTTTANLINGHPCVRVASTDDGVLHGAAFSIATTPAGLNTVQPVSVMVIAKCVFLSGADHEFFGSLNAINLGNNSSNWVIGQPSSGQFFDEGTSDTTTAHMFVGIWNGATSFFYVDGTAYGPLNMGNTDGFTGGISIGCRGQSGGLPIQATSGPIGEVRLWNRALTASNVTALRTQMQAKWGTP